MSHENVEILRALYASWALGDFHASADQVVGFEWVQLDEQFAFVWTVRDSKSVRMEQYPSRREALEAVGLAQ